jgi:hypothetical protein
MSVLTILGVALLGLSLFETKMVAREGKKMQAYYLARSGAEATAAWMLDPGNPGVSIINSDRSAIDITGAPNPSVNPPEFGAGAFGVKVYRNTPYDINSIIIESTASVDGIPSKAVLRLNESPVFDLSSLFPYAIYSSTDIRLTGASATIEGDLEARGTIDLNHNLNTGNLTENSAIIYPEPAFPKDTDLVVASDYNPFIRSDNSPYIVSPPAGKTGYRFGYINVQNNGVLVFKTPTGGYLDVVIDRMDMGGKLEIWGTGQLRLFVRNGTADPDVDFSGKIITKDASGTVDMKETGGHYLAKLFLISMAANSSIRLPGTNSFAGFINGPNAKVDLNGTPDFFGAIIGGVVGTNGNVAVTYDSEGASDMDPSSLPVIRFTRGFWMAD